MAHMLNSLHCQRWRHGMARDEFGQLEGYQAIRVADIRRIVSVGLIQRYYGAKRGAPLLFSLIKAACNLGCKAKCENRLETRLEIYLIQQKK